MAEPRAKREPIGFQDPVALEAALSSTDQEVMLRVAASHVLTEDLALAFLKRRDLAQAALESLSKNGRAMKSRKVKSALVVHAKTPRHVSLPMLRSMYTFELMQLALVPTILADIRMAVEDVLVGRLNTLTAGERLTLAKRSSARVAAALLQDGDKHILEAGLDNPHLTEALIVKALVEPKASELLAAYVCRHRKWPLRKEIQIAALRNAFTPFASAIRFAEPLSSTMLRDVFRQSKLPEKIQSYLLEIAHKREARKR